MAQLVEEAAARFGNATSLVIDESGQQLTFEELERRTRLVGSSLWELGMRRGDRLAVMLHNVAEFPIVWLGAVRVGVIMVPINPTAGDAEAEHVIRLTSPRAIVLPDSHLELIERIGGRGCGIEHLISTDGHHDRVELLGRLMEQCSGSLPGLRVVPEDATNIQFTSGSTGMPKGCLFGHRYWSEILNGFRAGPLRLDSSDVLLSPLPFFYEDAQWHILLSLMLGIPFVMLRRFSPSSFWDSVRRHRATFLYCLGAIPTLLLKTPATDYDRQHSVRKVVCPGIPKDLHDSLVRRYGVPWLELFGMNEVGDVLVMAESEHDKLIGSGCIGRVMPHREVRVVDDDDRPLEHGRIGELVVRGSGLMFEYFGDPQATAEVFHNGWFHTGDLVEQDIEGRFFYRGRKGERIRRSGENIAPSEVEQVLSKHPAVQLAAVVAVPDEIRGHEVKAYVVLQPGQTGDLVNPDVLAEFCAQQLARFKVPRYWEYRESFELLGSGKIDKQALIKSSGPDLRLGCYDRIERTWR